MKNSLFTSLIIFIFFGCASSTSVLYEFDETIDFDSYSTFVLCIDDLYVENTAFPNSDNNYVRELIANEIENQMIARNHQTNVLEPELQAGFELIIEEKEAEFRNCESEDEFEYWHECTIDTLVYSEETLVLYILDFDKNQVIWQASVACNMNKSKKNLPSYINELIAKMFNEYPKVANVSL